MSKQTKKQENYSPWLEDSSKQYITPGIPPQPRKIVTAANLNPETGILLVGARHGSPAMHSQLEAITGSPKIIKSRWIEGFIDQYDQFLTRREAKKIALKNGQELIGEDYGESLYSENLH